MKVDGYLVGQFRVNDIGRYEIFEADTDRFVELHSGSTFEYHKNGSWYKNRIESSQGEYYFVEPMNVTSDTWVRVKYTMTLTQEASLKVDEEILHFEGLHGAESCCHLRIEQLDNEKKITWVFLSELENNPGTSVTNFYAQLATKIYREKLSDVDPKNILWRENYTYGDRKNQLDCVLLKWNEEKKEFHSPEWRFLKTIDKDDLLLKD